MGRVSGSHMFGYTRPQAESVVLTSFDVNPDAWDVPDDVSAFVEYATFGLNPVSMGQNIAVDAPALSVTAGLGYGKSLLAVTVGGMLVWGTIGWIVDHKHLREGGLDETSQYEDFMYGWNLVTPPWER